MITMHVRRRETNRHGRTNIMTLHSTTIRSNERIARKNRINTKNVVGDKIAPEASSGWGCGVGCGGAVVHTKNRNLGTLPSPHDRFTYCDIVQ